MYQLELHGHNLDHHVITRQLFLPSVRVSPTAIWLWPLAYTCLLHSVHHGHPVSLACCIQFIVGIHPVSFDCSIKRWPQFRASDKPLALYYICVPQYIINALLDCFSLQYYSIFTIDFII